MGKKGGDIYMSFLEKGNYSFKHPHHGEVELRIGDRTVSVHGQRPKQDALGEISYITTLDQGAVGRTLDDAIHSLPLVTKALIRNFEQEFLAASDGREIVVFDSRVGMNVEERREMARTGEIPRGRRLLKSDSF